MGEKKKESRPALLWIPPDKRSRLFDIVQPPAAAPPLSAGPVMPHGQWTKAVDLCVFVLIIVVITTLKMVTR